MFNQQLFQTAERKLNDVTEGAGSPSAAQLSIPPGRAAAAAEFCRRRGNIDICQVKMSGFQKENDAAKSLFRRLEVFFFNVI